MKQIGTKISSNGCNDKVLYLISNCLINAAISFNYGLKQREKTLQTCSLCNWDLINKGS